MCFSLGIVDCMTKASAFFLLFFSFSPRCKVLAHYSELFIGLHLLGTLCMNIRHTRKGICRFRPPYVVCLQVWFAVLISYFLISSYSLFFACRNVTKRRGQVRKNTTRIRLMWLETESCSISFGA